jgi:hypothetical protein
MISVAEPASTEGGFLAERLPGDVIGSADREIA